MKGVVFCEFFNMVDQAFSAEMTETIIDKSDVESGGVYTAVGTYDHTELVKLVVALSKETGQDINVLVREFGRYLFAPLYRTSGDLLEGIEDSLSLIERVDDYIHVEVAKLYPDASLPTMTCERMSRDEIRLHYKSDKAMAELAHGLIESCVSHFGETVRIERKDKPGSEGREAEFLLEREAA